jgi:hypothetical protein
MVERGWIPLAAVAVALLGAVLVALAQDAPRVEMASLEVTAPRPRVPAQPTQLATEDAPNDDGKAVVLKWAASADDDESGRVVAGYVVYQAEEPQGPYGAVTSLLPPGTTENACRLEEQDREYYFQVRALGPEEAEARRLYRLARADQPLTLALSPGASAALPVAVGVGVGNWFHTGRTNVLVGSLLYSAIVLVTLAIVRRRKDTYIRPIAGLEAVDEAIGRATEMGRPILYITGLTGISDIATIASMIILGRIARRAAEYETPLVVPCNDPIVMSAEREIVREAYLEAGKPDAFNADNVFFVTDSQFGYAAAVAGLMMRDRPATNLYMGGFFAESLILAETGAATGAVQIAGTDQDTQLPFFVTACDYTLMGEELYAASAYLSRDPTLLSTLKGQDMGKLAIAAVLVAGVICATVGALSTPALAEKLMKFIQWFEIA